jgi:hypothetical protein
MLLAAARALGNHSPALKDPKGFSSTENEQHSGGGSGYCLRRRSKSPGGSVSTCVRTESAEMLQRALGLSASEPIGRDFTTPRLF